MPFNRPFLKTYTVLCKDSIKKVGSFFSKASKQLQHEVYVNLFGIYKFERLLKKYQRKIDKSEDDIEKITNERIKLESKFAFSRHRCDYSY